MRAIFAARDRANMQPTIDAFLDVLSEHPDEPEVLYEVGGAYDTDGQEKTAAEYYERALAGVLEPETLRKCYLQYGSTLRNLGRIDESIAIFSVARTAYPNSVSLGVFEVLTLHAQGKRDAALASALTLLVDHVETDEVKRYETSIRANAHYLRNLEE
ncbi:tetratricopeptide repeat protein [Arthrobacter sp. ISL-48]|nr:tetratricopeptide repeat protein [Arthrobacter sp. ISL-48]